MQIAHIFNKRIGEFYKKENKKLQQKFAILKINSIALATPVRLCIYTLKSGNYKF